MAGLFQRIRDSYPGVAVQLKEANFHSDDDIRTLSREDLHELLPGPGNLGQRKAVYELIHQQPIRDLLNNVKAFIPADTLTENGVLVDYLLILKELTTQVERIHTFLNTQVCLLEEHSNMQGSTVSQRPTGSKPDVGSSWEDLMSGINPAPYSRDVDPDESLRARYAHPEVQSSVTTQQTKIPTVKLMSIVSGNTLDSEKTLLDRVRYMGNITLVEDSSDPQLIVVFCPITSRIESDLESVMAKRPASLCDKPVLLVMMYHTHEPKAGVIQKPGSVLKRWNIVLDVNVFYHETVHGLVPCDMNTQAVTEMHATLLKHCSE
ncbi:hypothetical protein NHX12_026703 [Muraenolepis orangiensis]|uniref:Uncharacterized protein n=1 Tax=Muraenolepis orangiensis TaxID=630683 RepID=A0A9Q0EKP1_9TELE|nr:hypothetical protein NHX12_026703 [Muraenolepis orangiensis]